MSTSPRKLGRKYPNGCVNMALILCRIHRARKASYMVFDGHEPDPVGMTFTAGQDKASGGIRKVIETFKWENWRGPWNPAARIGDMDLDGVRMEVLYPEHGAELL